MISKSHLLISILVFAVLVLGACQPESTPTEVPKPTETQKSTEPPAEKPAEFQAEEATEEPVTAIHPALEDGKILIAWIPKMFTKPVFEIGRLGAETRAAELTAAGPYEVEIMYMASAASDMAEQARVMADAVTVRAEAIGVSCNNPTGCIDPINDAIGQGLPTMTWDSDAPDSDRFTFLGIDNYEGGQTAGELLVKYMGEAGKVALFTGLPGALNLEERIRGFTDYVADYPGIEIVTTIACSDDINLDVQVVEETMQAYPDLDGWFFVSACSLFTERGSMPLWEQASLDGMVNVVFEIQSLELDFMKDGFISGLVSQNYWGWGYDTVQMIYDKIVNSAEYMSFTNSGLYIVDACNVDIMAEMWAAQEFSIELPPTCSQEEIAGAASGMDIGIEDHPIKVLFVPSVDAEEIITGGELLAEVLNEATGLFFEVVVPTSYAATLEEMCASPADTIGFIPGLGYVLANQLCGVDVSAKAVRFGYDWYVAMVMVPRDSDIQSVEDLDGLMWGYPEAGSTSGYLYPIYMFQEAGITPGETVEAGGHTGAVRAVYNGEVDFATAFWSPPRVDGEVIEWEPGDFADVPPELLDSCDITEDGGTIMCGNFEPRDARPNLREEAPDVMQKVRVLATTTKITNDTISFSPEFDEAMRELIIQALFDFAANDPDGFSTALDAYSWNSINPATDGEYDAIRLSVQAVGFTIEDLGE